MTGPLRGNLYELLGLGPRCSVEQIERAYRFCLELYGDGGLATYSLLNPSELKQARAQVREAYETLHDPSQRIDYDVRHGFLAVEIAPSPSAADQSLRLAASRAVARPADQHVLPEPVTGAVLREYRERRGINLREIADSTKVGLRYLEYIEGDRYSMLPAPVYLRGFLYEYARAIGLEPRRTVDSYLARLPKEEP